jgi:hypothetical protein
MGVFMTTVQLTGLLLILVPLMFNVVFFLLQKTFDYPDILRRPTGEVLTRFQAGGTRLVALWYSFVLATLFFLPVAVLTPQVLAPDHLLFVVSATALGLLAGLVQILGLIRWPFVVPSLARAYSSPNATQGTRDAVVVVFQAFHRYAGAAVGEHLGYLFTSLWTVFIAAAMTQCPLFPGWLGWIGFIPAVGIFLGLFEEAGLKPAGAINAVSYILWSIWLVVAGFILLLA